MNEFRDFFEKNEKKFSKMNVKKKTINPAKRGTLITKIMLGNTFSIYNGREHKKVVINSYKLGAKLGEFALTRRRRRRFKRKKK